MKEDNKAWTVNNVFSIQSGITRCVKKCDPQPGGNAINTNRPRSDRGDKISRELIYRTLKTAIINMFLDLKESMTTTMKNRTI